jgi:hypothetical protein
VCNTGVPSLASRAEPLDQLEFEYAVNIKVVSALQSEDDVEGKDSKWAFLAVFGFLAGRSSFCVWTCNYVLC